MIERWLLSSVKLSSLVLTPSMVTSPLLTSEVRKSTWNKELLPDPVRPTTPTFSRPLVTKDKSCKAGGRCSLYLKLTSLKTMIPWAKKYLSRFSKRYEWPFLEAKYKRAFAEHLNGNAQSNQLGQFSTDKLIRDGTLWVYLNPKEKPESA